MYLLDSFVVMYRSSLKHYQKYPSAILEKSASVSEEQWSLVGVSRHFRCSADYLWLWETITKKEFKTYAYCFYDLDLEGDESMSMAVCLLIQHKVLIHCSGAVRVQPVNSLGLQFALNNREFDRRVLLKAENSEWRCRYHSFYRPNLRWRVWW